VETPINEKKELVENLRQEWKTMWKSRIDDEVRAEGIADKTYERLFIDRGLILFATRKFKPPEFQEILRKYLTSEEAERLIPDPVKGGIRKFIREYITANNKISRSQREEWVHELDAMKKKQQSSHGGRGWLHFSLPKVH
jgi:membrane-bound lytic murein transglycosylase B